MMPEIQITPILPSIPYNTSYPEVYYKILPYIILACDQLEANNIIPDQDMLDQISDNIHNDVLEMYPEIEDYVKGLDNMAVQTIARMPSNNNRRFRRRGIFRDLIDLLLLSEFNRRRRRNY